MMLWLYYIGYWIWAVGRVFSSVTFSRRSHFLSQFCLTAIPLYTSLRLIISKILKAKSSLSSLSPLYYSNIIALFYKKLDIDSWSVLVWFLSQSCLTVKTYVFLYI